MFSDLGVWSFFGSWCLVFGVLVANWFFSPLFLPACGIKTKFCSRQASRRQRAWASGPRRLPPLRQRRRDEHEHPTGHHGLDQISTEKFLHQRPKGHRREDLGQDDEE